MNIKANVAANFLGQAWRAVLGIAFIPVYIQYLGIESYGLIGVYAMLQAWLSLFDLGLRPALSREMSRFMGGEVGVVHVRDLLRSIEIIGLLTAAVVIVGVWVASPWLAQNWLSSRSLSPQIMTRAVTIMGAVSALTLLDTIYLSSLVGLQRQVHVNVVTGAIATLRYGGVIGVLAWVSPTIEAYFLWQLFTSILSAITLAFLVYGILPMGERRAQFSKSSLGDIWGFASGMIVITILSLLLTQVDKTLLSRLLPLEEFAYYTLAATMTSALYMLVVPITTAFYPRMTQIIANDDTVSLARTYHQGAQLVTVLLSPAALMLIVFSERVLMLWTGNQKIAENVEPLLCILAFGTLLHGFMWMPYHLQLAHGWTSLAIKINTVAVGILTPAIYFAVRKYGAVGAASMWVLLNIGYVIFNVTLMHHRILPCEKWRWYIEDVGLPLAAIFAAAQICSYAVPKALGPVSEALLLASIYLFMTMIGFLTTPLLRQQLLLQFRGVMLLMKNTN